MPRVLQAPARGHAVHQAAAVDKHVAVDARLWRQAGGTSSARMWAVEVGAKWVGGCRGRGTPGMSGAEQRGMARTLAGVGSPTAHAL